MLMGEWEVIPGPLSQILMGRGVSGPSSQMLVGGRRYCTQITAGPTSSIPSRFQHPKMPMVRREGTAFSLQQVQPGPVIRNANQGEG